MTAQAGEGRIYVFMITSSKQGLFLYHWFSFVNSTVATTNYHLPQLFPSIYTPLTKTHTLSKRPSSAVKGRNKTIARKKVKRMTELCRGLQVDSAYDFQLFPCSFLLKFSDLFFYKFPEMLHRRVDSSTAVLVKERISIADEGKKKERI